MKIKNSKIMDLGSSIIGVIVIAVCTLPFIIVSRNKKRREKETLQMLTKIAGQQECKITSHEFFNNKLIGIDELRNFVFFIEKYEDKYSEKFVNLAEIQACKVKNTTRVVSIGKENNTIIEKIELSFIPFDKKKKEVEFEFYDTEKNMQLSGELQTVEKWSNTITRLIKTKK